ncbi:ABC transporter substrate-binding protein [Candidatus Bipolaricaulota bacterium]|nr:ABC transporter substrate-binding protein [Candidatus Bipolaricaulota bacterium]
MGKFITRCLSVILSVLLASCSVLASPANNEGVRWRLAYYEGGSWVDYQGEFVALVDSLVSLGWIEPFEWPATGSQDDMLLLWDWLAGHAKSTYIEFVKDAFWSSDWQSELRLRNRADVIARLSSVGDIDLILAMGTWAGLDLANDQHSTPTLVMSTNNPVQAGIIKSVHDSGFDHVHARADPDRFIRQITAFHNLVGFERLGIIYDDTAEGRVFAVLDDALTVANRLGFELVTCMAPDSDVSEDQAVELAFACLEELAPQIDGFLITSHIALTAEHLPGVLAPLFQYNVPTWALEGPDLVKRGALMSIQRESYQAIGQFQARNVDQILNGVLPRQLNQILEEPKALAVNLEVARQIGFDLPPGLITVADVVFETIEGESL